MSIRISAQTYTSQQKRNPNSTTIVYTASGTKKSNLVELIMKSIKKTTALSIAVIMLLLAIFPTSAYVFEGESCTQYFTSLPWQYRQSHAYVSVTEFGGNGLEGNNFNAQTIFQKSVTEGTYNAKIIVSAELVSSENHEVFTETDTVYCYETENNMAASVDGSCIISEFSLIGFNVEHTIELYVIDANNNYIPIINKVIRGSTTS